MKKIERHQLGEGCTILFFIGIWQKVFNIGTYCENNNNLCERILKFILMTPPDC